MTRDNRLLFGPLALAIFMAGILVLPRFIPGYDSVRQTVSEIGEVGSPAQMPFMIMLLAIALCLFGFALALRRVSVSAGIRHCPHILPPAWRFRLQGLESSRSHTRFADWISDTNCIRADLAKRSTCKGDSGVLVDRLRRRAYRYRCQFELARSWRPGLASDTSIHWCRPTRAVHRVVRMVRRDWPVALRFDGRGRKMSRFLIDRSGNQAAASTRSRGGGVTATMELLAGSTM